MIERFNSILELLSQGGWVMIPLGICSLLSAAIVVERILWGPSQSRLFPQGLQTTVDQLINENRLQELLGVCRSQSNALSRVVETILIHRQKPKSELIRHAEIVGQNEASRLNRRVAVLGTIAAICPLMGLLGTVFGMISTFEVIQYEGVGNANALAGGIAEALISTATGLSIAIPALVFYRAFLHQSKQLIIELEQRSTVLLERVYILTQEEEEKQSIHA